MISLGTQRRRLMISTTMNLWTRMTLTRWCIWWWAGCSTASLVNSSEEGELGEVSTKWKCREIFLWGRSTCHPRSKSRKQTGRMTGRPKKRSTRMMSGKTKTLVIKERENKIVMKEKMMTIQSFYQEQRTFLWCLSLLRRIYAKPIVNLSLMIGRKFKCKFDNEVLKEETLVGHFEKKHIADFNAWLAKRKKSKWLIN